MPNIPDTLALPGRTLPARSLFRAAWLSRGVFAVLLAGTPSTVVAQPPPSTIISRGVPAFASSAHAVAGAANDADYATEWRSGGQPAWLAYDLSSVPAARRQSVLVAWYTNSGGDYDASVLPANRFHNVPGPYVIEGHRGPGGGAAPTDGWVLLATSPAPQQFHTNQHHLPDFAAYTWLRFRTTGGNPQNDPVNPDVAINLDVHTAGADAVDSWMFYGDSLTSDCWTPGAFAHLLQAARPGLDPAAANGGIPFLKTGDVVPLMARWLPLFPGRYVVLAYGTNDAGDPPATFGANLRRLIEMVLAAGKVPIVPTVPWAAPTQRDDRAIRALNREIAGLYRRFGDRLVTGPDLYAAFAERPDLLRDGLHLNEAGLRVMRQAWVEAALSGVYRDGR